MGQVRWAGWTMAIATALVISGGQGARADVASDKPAAIVVYPKIVVDSSRGVDTIIRLTNTNLTSPINVHCFYVDANSHCTNTGAVCSDSSTCGGFGLCVPAWVETDFDIVLTARQPIEWEAVEGMPGSDGFCAADPNVPCSKNADCVTASAGNLCNFLPLPVGVCSGNQFLRCGTDADCAQFGAGNCSQSNAGTHIPPVGEDPFVGELKCIAVDANGVPIARNDLKGEANIETSTTTNLDVASYNGIGIQATAAQGTSITDSPLTLGPSNAGDYNGCPNVLILNNFFDLATDPVSGDVITTDLTLVPCTEDFLRQVGGSAVVQYLVFNEFEQRLSTSRAVDCFSEIQLCNIDTPQCARSIFSVGFQGTLTGQTRLSPIGSGLLGVAIERHTPGADTTLTRSAAFNLHFAGARDTADTITIP